MKRFCIVIICGIVVGLGLGWLLGSSSTQAQDVERPLPAALIDVGPGFTYQGKLEQNNLPVSVNCDFEFRLFDVAVNGSQFGAVDAQSNVTISDGLFIVTLNAANEFGADAFNGQSRWLEIRVRCPAGSQGWTILEPRQPLTPAPYAASLQPGAIISGTVAGGMLNLTNNSGSGLYIDSASVDGVDIVAAGDDGVVVRSADDIGVIVNSAGNEGLYVNAAGGDGLFVCRTGNESSCVLQPTLNNGVEISRAEHNGVYVGSAGNYGVNVQNSVFGGVFVNVTSGDGFKVNSAGQDGVSVINAGVDGMYARGELRGIYGDTKNLDGEWGLFTNDQMFAYGGLTTTAVTLITRVTGVNKLNPGDLVTAVGIADTFTGSSTPQLLVQLSDSSNFSNVIGVVKERMVKTAHSGREESEREDIDWHSEPGPASEGDYVALTVLGVAEVRVDGSFVIQQGQRLTASEIGGAVRPLRTETLNGMVVSEGAPVIGIALAAPERGKDTIPIFVTLR